MISGLAAPPGEHRQAARALAAPPSAAGRWAVAFPIATAIGVGALAYLLWAPDGAPAPVPQAQPAAVAPLPAGETWPVAAAGSEPKVPPASPSADARQAADGAAPSRELVPDPHQAALTIPTPVPLGRETRDPQGAARVAAQQAADHQRQLEDSAAPRPGQQFSHARVTEADLGVSFLPQGAQDLAQSSRTAEPGYGSTVSTQLRSSLGIEAALAYYRKELRLKFPKARLDEERPGPAFATLTASDAQSPLRVSVFLNQTRPGVLTVSLSRWDGSAAAAQPGN